MRYQPIDLKVWFVVVEMHVSEQEIHSLYLGLKKSIIQKYCTVKTTTVCGYNKSSSLTNSPADLHSTSTPKCPLPNVPPRDENRLFFNRTTKPNVADELSEGDGWKENAEFILHLHIPLLSGRSLPPLVTYPKLGYAGFKSQLGIMVYD